MYVSSVRAGTPEGEGRSSHHKISATVIGLGVVSLVAALQGARVVGTDYEADALAFARYNAQRNACQEQLDRASAEVERIDQTIAAERFAQDARTRLTEAEAALAKLAYDGAAHREATDNEQRFAPFESRKRELDTARTRLEGVQRELASICEATGAGVIRDSEALHFKPVMIRVAVEKSEEYGDKNVVKRVKPLGGATIGTASSRPPAASAPQPSSAVSNAPASQRSAAAAGSSSAGSSRPWAR